MNQLSGSRGCFVCTWASEFCSSCAQGRGCGSFLLPRALVPGPWKLLRTRVLVPAACGAVSEPQVAHLPGREVSGGVGVCSSLCSMRLSPQPLSSLPLLPSHTLPAFLPQKYLGRGKDLEMKSGWPVLLGNHPRVHLQAVVVTVMANWRDQLCWPPWEGPVSCGTCIDVPTSHTMLLWPGRPLEVPWAPWWLEESPMTWRESPGDAVPQQRVEMLWE